MAVEKTKHQFVDDNPYLVYSGEPESTVDSAGGGGGGSNIDPFYFEVDTHTDWKNPQYDENQFSVLMKAMESNTPVYVFENKNTKYARCTRVYPVYVPYGSGNAWVFSWLVTLVGNIKYQGTNQGEGIISYTYRFNSLEASISILDVYYAKADKDGPASDFDLVP